MSVKPEVLRDWSLVYGEDCVGYLDVFVLCNTKHEVSQPERYAWMTPPGDEEGLMGKRHREIPKWLV